MELNLSGGESVIIKANTETKVTCGGGGSMGTSCDSAAAGFRKTLEYCYKNQSGLYCAQKYWPKFKKDNPSCIYSGMDACLEYCYKNQSGQYCAEMCQ